MRIFSSTGKKRCSATRACRQPRVPFTQLQHETLEQKYQAGHYLTDQSAHEISVAINASQQRIKIWFQNRRARDRRDAKQSVDIDVEYME